MNRPLIAGNWKMHKTAAEAVSFVAALRAAFVAEPAADVWVFPPMTAIEATASAARGSWVHVGAQNVHEAESGAFTGEVSTGMVAAAGATAVLIGHSERRHLFGESDARIAAKVRRVLTDHLVAVLCVGETLAERDAGRAESVVRAQLDAALAGLTRAEFERVVVAYEPVWAIGTGRTATPEIAQAMHAVIRAWLRAAGASSCPVLYGGSVKPDNSAQLLAQPDIDGLLVGGASLDPRSFADIVRARTT